MELNFVARGQDRFNGSFQYVETDHLGAQGLNKKNGFHAVRVELIELVSDAPLAIGNATENCSVKIFHAAPAPQMGRGRQFGVDGD